jgi:hypothetical protein
MLNRQVSPTSNLVLVRSVHSLPVGLTVYSRVLLLVLLSKTILYGAEHETYIHHTP